MVKKGLLALILVVAMVVPTLAGAETQALPGSGWWTGQQIQNIGTQAATIVSTAYDATSSATYVASASGIAPGASTTFLPTNFTGMGNGFQGSAVVASDQPIKAIVTLTNRKVGTLGVDGGVAAGQYQGIDGAAASTEVRFPIAKSDFGSKTSTFYIQNAGSTSATVHAVYACGTAGTFSNDSTSMNPGQMVVMSPAGVVPSGTNCSATMTSTQPIAGVGTEHWTSETVATLVQAVRGFTSADYSTTIYAPSFKKKYPNHPTQGRSTGAQIMNVGSADTVVHAIFYYSGGTCTAPNFIEMDSPSIAPGASTVFLKPAAMPDGCQASAKFTATQNIVGIVNESFLDPVPPKGTQSSTAYNMLSAQSATTQIAVPLYKEKFGSKSTGLQVQNIGSSDATVHLVFKSGTSTWTTVDKTISAGASMSFYLVSGDTSLWVGGNAMPAGTNAGVQVFSTGTNAQNILGIAVESTYPLCFGQGTTPCYDRLNYEGFNLQP